MNSEELPKRPPTPKIPRKVPVEDDLFHRQLRANITRRQNADLEISKCIDSFREVMEKDLFIDTSTAEYMRLTFFRIRSLEKRIEELKQGYPATMEEIEQVKNHLKTKALHDPIALVGGPEAFGKLAIESEELERQCDELTRIRNSLRDRNSALRRRIESYADY